MNVHQFYTGRTMVFFLIIGVLCLVAGFYALNNFIYSEKQDDGTVVEPYRGTLSGEYVCLPHVDTAGPQTTECAFGLKTDVGEYYAIDFGLMSQMHNPFITGERVSASGVITPIERLSTDHWRQYPIEGIFSITDSLEVID